MPDTFIALNEEEIYYVRNYWNVNTMMELYQSQIREALDHRSRLMNDVVARHHTVATGRTLSVIDARRPELNRGESTGRRGYTFQPEGAPPVSFSLGWELEANHEAVRVPAGIDRHSDGSVDGAAREYVVYPTLVNSPSYVLGLLKDLVHMAGLNTNRSCGFHVHIAPRKCTVRMKRRWALMMERLGKAVEDRAFEAVPPSRQDNSYCRRIFPTVAGTRFDPMKYDNSRRYHWINTVEMFRPGGIRTVEVRLLGNTHRWRYLLAWAAFCMELGLQAWRLAHGATELDEAAARVSLLLEGIRDQVRPLEYKKADVPAWVWLYLAQHGIKRASFERPLKGLADTESKLNYTYVMPYSDMQPTEPDESNDCPHGNDRENDCCYECDHEEGNCNGSPDCEYCRDARHADGEDCEYRRCTLCERIRQGEAV